MRLTGSLVYPFEGDAPQGGIFEHLATFASSISSVCEVSRFARMRDRDSGERLNGGQGGQSSLVGGVKGRAKSSPCKR